MKIAVLGTGMVGNALATKLVQLGHQIMMGSRTATSDAAQEWLRSVGGKAKVGTFADAAAFGELAFDCTNGANSIAALRQAGAVNLRGKILIQVGNPLDFSRGMPPSLTVCNTDSLGEQTQREFPDVRVVKALNTLNCDLMIAPSCVPGDHELFICGNDAVAKREVTDRLCEWFGWKPGNIPTWATSPTHAAPRCFSRCGCVCGACWERRTSTFTWLAESERHYPSESTATRYCDLSSQPRKGDYHADPTLSVFRRPLR